MAKLRKFKADPGHDGMVRGYVEVWLQAGALMADAREAERRGERAKEKATELYVDKFHEHLLNMLDEMTLGEKAEVSTVIKKIKAGYMITWRYPTRLG